MKYKLTERLIKSLSPKPKPYEAVDDALPGFLVRIQPSGAMTYCYSYRTHDGKRTRVVIGGCESIALIKAKELARQYAGQVAAGIDPQAERQKKRAKAAREKVQAFGDFITEVYSPWVKINRKSGSRTLYILRSYFSDWNTVPMNQITHARAGAWQEKELSRGIKPATANRNLNAPRGVLTLAVERGIIEHNPLDGFKDAYEYDEERIRYLSSDEMSRLIAALEARNIRMIEERRSANLWRQARGYRLMPDIPSSAYADYLYPMVVLDLHTGMRRGELFALMWGRRPPILSSTAL